MPGRFKSNGVALSYSKSAFSHITIIHVYIYIYYYIRDGDAGVVVVYGRIANKDNAHVSIFLKVDGNRHPQTRTCARADGQA